MCYHRQIASKYKMLVFLLELLNEAEFGKDARNLEYDEKTINPASDLGLLVGV